MTIIPVFKNPCETWGRPRGGARWAALVAVAPLAGLLLAAVLLLPMARPAVAQQAPMEPLTLADAMARARSDAPAVAAATARQRASEARHEEARAHRLPTLSLEQTWLYTDGPADVFGLQLNQERFSFSEFVAGDPNDPDFLDSSLTRLELALPVYTGGEISTRIEQAELERRAALQDADWSADRAALEAARGYLQLAQAREQVELLERSLETIEAHARRARAQVDQGLVVSSEALRAEVEVARVRDELSHARGQARVAAAALAFHLGADGENAVPDWRLEPLTAPPPLPDDLATWLASTPERPDLEAARHRVAAAELETHVARAARKPHLGVAIQQSFHDEWPLGGHGDSTAVVARGTLEIFAGGRHKAAVRAAEAQARAAALELARARDGARLAVRSAWERARSARERHTTARAALTAAREAERITTERFGQGVVRMIDLLDAITARRQAEARELVARAQARLATLELAQEAGRDPESALTAPTSAGPTGVVHLKIQNSEVQNPETPSSEEDPHDP